MLKTLSGTFHLITEMLLPLITSTTLLSTLEVSALEVKFSSASEFILPTCMRFYMRLTVCIKQQNKKKKRIAVRLNNWPISTVRRKKKATVSQVHESR